MSMDANTCMGWLNKLADTSARSEKEAILDTVLEDAFMQRVIKWALDPYMRFGIATWPDIAEPGDKVLTLESPVWPMLSAMAKGKISGGRAEEALIDTLCEFDADSGEIIKRIILKDLRAGVGEKTVNKVRKGFIPIFACQLAHPYEKHQDKVDWSRPWRFDPKIDGMRVLVKASAEGVEFMTREGRPIPALDHLAPAFMAAAEKYGEPVFLDGEGWCGSFKKTISELRQTSRPAEGARIFLFDIIPADHFVQGKSEIPYAARRGHLEAFGKHMNKKVAPILPSYFVGSHEEALSVYAKFREKGFEGAMLKDPAASYECKRTRAWLKMKGCEDADVTIEGAFEGTGKYEGQLGGFMVQHKGKTVRVGGGFSNEQRVNFWKVWKAAPHKLQGRVIQVEYHEETPDGSLRHPRFVRFRPDKDEAAKEVA